MGPAAKFEPPGYRKETAIHITRCASFSLHAVQYTIVDRSSMLQQDSDDRVAQRRIRVDPEESPLRGDGLLKIASPPARWENSLLYEEERERERSDYEKMKNWGI